MRLCLLFIAIFCVSCQQNQEQQYSKEETILQEPKQGIWRAVLHSPGGELPFRMELNKNNDAWSMSAINDQEKLPFDQVEVLQDGNMRFGIQHYDSIFTVKLSKNGERMDGQWRKVSGQDEEAKLDFHADYGDERRFILENPKEPTDFSGQWLLHFEDMGDKPYDGIAQLTQNGAHLSGTILTATGDYRFLEGMVDGNTFYLSCFDGGHAFLFKATLNDGQLSGDFWSRDHWHDLFKGSKEENPSLGNPYELTSLTNEQQQFRFSFPNAEGELIDQDHESLQGKVRLITIFGTWCPNCNDEAPFLQELYDTYKDQGLTVLGLAFEMTNDQNRSKRVIKQFQKRHKVSYPILLAGDSTDKAAAVKALPDLNQVLAYPTTLLIDRNGKVHAIHTGFTGPGTGQAYENLKNKYHKLIKEVL